MLILPIQPCTRAPFFVVRLILSLSLYIVCAWVHYTMLACRWLVKIMEVNEALQSPPSSPYSGVIVSDTAGHRRKSNRNTLLLKSHCSPPLRGVSYHGNGWSTQGKGWRGCGWVGVVQVWLSLSAICIDSCDLFLIFCLCEILKMTWLNSSLAGFWCEAAHAEWVRMHSFVSWNYVKGRKLTVFYYICSWLSVNCRSFFQHCYW